MYRETQALMKEGKLEEGYESAKKAMQQFIAEEDDLFWMLLESIEAGDKRINVHFNMGRNEREMPDDGIFRPLSFHICSGGEDPRFLQKIDFEIGRGDGRSISAALGRTTETGHVGYEYLDADASYETIRQLVIELVTRLGDRR